MAWIGSGCAIRYWGLGVFDKERLLDVCCRRPLLSKPYRDFRTSLNSAISLLLSSTSLLLFVFPLDAFLLYFCVCTRIGDFSSSSSSLPSMLSSYSLSVIFGGFFTFVLSYYYSLNFREGCSLRGDLMGLLLVIGEIGVVEDYMRLNGGENRWADSLK